MAKTMYPEPKRIKVGRNKFVCDFDGKTYLQGLSWDSCGIFFYTFWKSEQDVKVGRKSRKDYSFGSNYENAVLRFKAWRKEEEKFTVLAPAAVEFMQSVVVPYTEKQRQGLQEIYDDLGVDEIVPTERTIQGTGLEQDMWPGAKLTTHIQVDKQYASKILKQLLSDDELRIEAIRILKLDDLLPKKEEILTIDEVIMFFIAENKSHDREKRQCQSTIDYFIKAVGKRNINDITENDIYKYKDYVANDYEINKWASTWHNNKITKLKTVFHFYVKNKRGNEPKKKALNKIIGYCKSLHKIKEDIKEPPKSFELVTVTEIIEKAQAEKNEQMLLMLLLMLNTGYYPTDIRNLEKSMIRKKEKLTYILFSRKKTGSQYKRINCLWHITAELLNKQIKKYPNSKYVFINAVGTKYGESTLAAHFATFLKDVKHEDGIQVYSKHFRDTVASSLAFEVHPNILKVTLGHTVTKDEFWKYVDSRPEQQKPASDAIYKKFKEAIESINFI